MDNNRTLTVKDYAYESTPNIAIIAGDNGITSVDEFGFDTYFHFYPNPATTRITIETKNDVKIKQVRIINLAGQVVYTNNKTFSNTLIIPKPLQGLFFLQIETAGNRVLNK